MDRIEMTKSETLNARPVITQCNLTTGGVSRINSCPLKPGWVPWFVSMHIWRKKPSQSLFAQGEKVVAHLPKLRSLIYRRKWWTADFSYSGFVTSLFRDNLTCTTKCKSAGSDRPVIRLRDLSGWQSGGFSLLLEDP